MLFGVEKVNYQGKIFTRKLNDKNPTKRNYFFGEIYDRIIKRSKKISLHRYIWQKQHGIIPFGCLIHHKDKDPLNNDISNLECIPEYEHLHNYHGELKYKNAKDKSCEVCGKTFKAKTKRSKLCLNCRDLIYHSAKEKREWREKTRKNIIKKNMRA